MARFFPFVGAVRHTIWGWPAVLNFFLGGMGSLFYAVSFLFDGSLSAHAPGNEWGFWRLIGPGLSALGFLAVVTEAGKPRHAVFLLQHLHRSWMSREVLAGGLFIGGAVGYALSSLPALKWLAIAAAVCLSVCQAMMLYDSKGVTLWSAAIVPLQCLSANLLAAAALLLGVALWTGTAQMVLMAATMVLILVDGGAWVVLLRHRPTTEHRNARIPLFKTSSFLIALGVGHLLPFLLLVAVLVINAIGDGQGVLMHSLIPMTVLMVLAGGLAQKADVVLDGNSLRPIQRGENFFHRYGAHGE
ncbi:hypothetical protein Dvar_71630 [Desulfosarcina variabilis str. Montpellier]|uniref:hypothetical protein n=1 Tax=Desulfosarcina variabilis TaxID=2300 RepID=UPI003AFADA3F